MNQSVQQGKPGDASAITIDIRIAESWIRKMIRKADRTFTLRDREFNQISISLNQDLVTIGARVVGKENSTVGISVRPHWDAVTQKLRIEDVLLQTNTTNIILKSMGWIASNFMQEKINDKIEDAAHQLIERYRKEYSGKPVVVPVRDHGSATVHVDTVTIHSMEFAEKAVLLNVTIQGKWSVSLEH